MQLDQSRFSRPQNVRGLTLLEVIVLLAVMAILAVLMLPALPGKGRKARRANCVSNLKQIGMGFMNYAIDREDNYPWNIPRKKVECLAASGHKAPT